MTSGTENGWQGTGNNFEKGEVLYKKSILFAAASLVCGIGVGFFAPELGVVVAVSITGLGIMNILENK